MRAYLSIVPNACDTEAQARRASHLDLVDLDPKDAWAELEVLRRYLAELIMTRRRRLRIVRHDLSGNYVNEREWLEERITLLEARLARGEAAR